MEWNRQKLEDIRDRLEEQSDELILELGPVMAVRNSCVLMHEASYILSVLLDDGVWLETSQETRAFRIWKTLKDADDPDNEFAGIDEKNRVRILRWAARVIAADEYSKTNPS